MKISDDTSSEDETDTPSISRLEDVSNDDCFCDIYEESMESSDNDEISRWTIFFTNSFISMKKSFKT